MRIQLSGKFEGLTASDKYRLKRKFKKLNRFLVRFPRDAQKGDLHLDRDPQNRLHAKLVFWVPDETIIAEDSHRKLNTVLNSVIKKAVRQIRRHKRKLRQKK
jgi:ribosome-associated translation inhibitor RaiA